MDFMRLLKKDPDLAFRVMESFELIVGEDNKGVLCDELTCPDLTVDNMHIALLMALGKYDIIEELYGGWHLFNDEKDENRKKRVVDIEASDSPLWATAV